MSLKPEYAPQEPAAALLFEKVQFLGQSVLSGFSFGILATLYTLCLTALAPQLKKPAHKKWATFHILYTTALFALVGAGTSSNAIYSQQIWISNRGYPGGPFAFINTEESIPVLIWGWAVFVVASWLQDSYVIYRCLVFWNKNIWICTAPVLGLLASIGTSTALLVELASPKQGLFGLLTLRLATCWYVFSVFVNVFCTMAIVGRLIWKRREINAALGRSHSKMYAGVVAILIESAAIYSIVGFIYIGAYLKKSPSGVVILPFLGNLEGICPTLIIYRVAIGRGWTHQTVQQINTGALSSIRFERPKRSTVGRSTSYEENQSTVNQSSHDLGIESAEYSKQKSDDTIIAHFKRDVVVV